MLNNNQKGAFLINQYRVQSELGKGGMATTFKAQVLNSNQEVAIKKISLRHTENFKVISLFEREANILRQLDHPNIPKYIDFLIVSQKLR